MLLRSRTSTTSGPVPPLAREYQFDGLLGMALAMAALAFFTPSLKSSTPSGLRKKCVTLRYGGGGPEGVAGDRAGRCTEYPIVSDARYRPLVEVAFVEAAAGN